MFVQRAEDTFRGAGMRGIGRHTHTSRLVICVLRLVFRDGIYDDGDMSTIGYALKDAVIAGGGTGRFRGSRSHRQQWEREPGRIS